MKAKTLVAGILALIVAASTASLMVNELAAEQNTLEFIGKIALCYVGSSIMSATTLSVVLHEYTKIGGIIVCGMMFGIFGLGVVGFLL